MKGPLLFGVVCVLGAILLRRIFFPSLQEQETSSSRPARAKLPSELTADSVAGHVPLRPEIEHFAQDTGYDKRRQFIQVADGVWVAVNYALGNVVILDAPRGLIVVDTTESRDAALEIRQKLRTVSQKPIAAIVFTHSHFDHIHGVESFIEDLSKVPDIWAHETFASTQRANLLPGPRYLRGTIGQFGAALGEHRAWPPHLQGRLGHTRPPNRLVHGHTQTVDIAGLSVTFMHIPGESDDEMAVWLPDRRVLLAADDVYKAFPNLYAIRGTVSRDSMLWADSVRRMRDLEPDHLLLQHGYPIAGRENIRDVLTAYASAIQFVHDQTVRYMNKQYHPDDVAELVRLPPALADHPYLKEMYGRVDWASKSVYQRYVGWFSGDPIELGPLSPKQRAERLVKAVGVDRLLSEASEALENDDPQWALELSTDVLRVEPDNADGRGLRLASLRALAAAQLNPTARNYYLTAALDDHKLIDWPTDRAETLLPLDLATLLDLLRVRVKAELVEGVNATLYLQLNDTKQVYKMQMLYSVLTVTTVKRIPVSAGLAARSTVPVIKRVVVGQLAPATAFTAGLLELVAGDLPQFRQFFDYFEAP